MSDVDQLNSPQGQYLLLEINATINEVCPRCGTWHKDALWPLLVFPADLHGVGICRRCASSESPRLVKTADIVAVVADDWVKGHDWKEDDGREVNHETAITEAVDGIRKKIYPERLAPNVKTPLPGPTAEASRTQSKRISDREVPLDEF